MREYPGQITQLGSPIGTLRSSRVVELNRHLAPESPLEIRPVTALFMPSCSSQPTSWPYVGTQPAVFHFDGVLGEESEVELALV